MSIRRVVALPLTFLFLWGLLPRSLSARSSAEVAEKQRRIVEHAQRYLGAPYVWGAEGPHAFDCSGFVWRVYREVGYTLPRVSRDQAKRGRAVSRGDLQTGDLLFFVKAPGRKRITHVGIYLSEGRFIHAAQGGGEVRIDRLDAPYYRDRFKTARRIVGVEEPAFLAKGEAPIFATPSPAASPPPSVASIPPPSEETREHEGRTPLTYATHDIDRPIGRYAPLSLRGAENRLVMTTGVANFGGRRGGIVVPGLSLFFPGVPLGIDLALPIFLDPAPGEGEAHLDPGPYERFGDFLRPLESVRVGQVGAALFGALSRTGSVTVGSGSLLERYPVNLESRTFPALRIVRDALSFEGRFDFDRMGGEMFLDDVTDPHLVAIAPFLRPWWGGEGGGRRIGFTFVQDFDAPTLSGEARRVTGGGIFLEDRFRCREGCQITTTLDLSALSSGDTLGFGTSFVATAHLAASDHGHRFSVRLGGRLHEADFIPNDFGGLYPTIRSGIPISTYGISQIVPLADLPARLEGGPLRAGPVVGLEYAWFSRFTLGVLYEESFLLGEGEGILADPSFTVDLGIRDLPFPVWGRRIDLHLFYATAYLEDRKDLFHFDAAAEYLYLSAALELFPHLSLEGALRGAFFVEDARTGQIDALHDGYIALTCDWRF